MRSLMAVAFLVVVLVRTALAEPVPLWTVEFDSVGTVLQKSDSRPEMAAGGSGAGLIVSIPPGGISSVTSIAKIDGNGTPIWMGQHASSTSYYGTPPKARVLSDGSVIVIADAIYRYASTGQLLWAASVPSSSGSGVVEVGGRLFVASSTSGHPASVIDLASGRTLESLSVANMGLYQDAGLAAVGNDTVYAFNAQGMWIHKFRLDPLRIEWSVSLSGVTSPREPVGLCCRSSIIADDSGAYVPGQSFVAKISPVDGSLLWSQTTVPDYNLALAADAASPTDILVVGPNLVWSLARSTGARRWTHVPPSPLSALKAFDDAVVVVGSGGSTSGSTAGFMERIHRDSGAVLWQQPINGLPGVPFSVGDVGVDGDRIAASGSHCATGQAPELCEWVIWQASVDGGAVEMVKPMFRQSVERARSTGNAESTFAAALVATPASPRILVRHIRNSDGVVLWETSISAAFPNAPGRAIDELNVVLTRTASPDVVVAFSRRPDGAVRPQPVGDAVVAKLRGSDGALQWRRSLVNFSDGFTETAASAFSIATDTAGNVFASVHEVRPNLLSGLFDADRREIRKYSSASGDELFRIAFQPTHSGTSVFLPAPPTLDVVDDVLMTPEPPLPRTDFGVFGISADTGSVLWTSGGTLYLRPPYLSEGSTAFSAYAQYGPSPLMRLTRLDANTGSRVWESSYGHPSDSEYSQPAISRGSGNGVYLGTGSRMFPSTPNGQYSYAPRVLRFDEASGAIIWANRFENGPVRPYSLARPLFGIDEILLTVQSSYRASVSFGSFLTGLSEADGTFQGTTALYFDNPGWQQLPATRLDIPGLLSGNGMIVRRYGDLPGEPTRFSVRKWPLPQPFSGGSLRTSMAASASVIAGQRVSSFRFDVVNDGTVRADAVEAIVGLPPQSIIDNVTCTIAGSPCVAEATPRYLRKLGDIGIGERLVITATIRSSATQAANPSIEASAFSTIGLVEMDMKDNVASANLLDVVFNNGFDQ